MRANDFLAKLKDTGMSYEDILQKLNPEPEPQEQEIEEEIPEEEDIEEDEEEPEDTNIPQPPIDVKKIASDVSADVKKELKKFIQTELKKLRGKPPKGKQGSEPIGPSPVISKNLFEKIV